MSDSKQSFHRQHLIDFLEDWYNKQMSSALRQPRPATDVAEHGGSVFDIQPEMSSTKAVRILLELRDMLGFEPSKDVIKKGGYKNKEEFVQTLSSRVEQAFKAKQSAPSVVDPNKQAKEADKHAQL